ncbi:hypothetical protein Dret_2543 (plasmid) [Desulfohalobium retbaense DSM 5692]|uniref:Uncharacterized protein n=1 Tax=Desulfohalobium retbaense (strain ATCC 49708 / DSM 5692 / JCM 16813 / HR100) TaxID=485915 RepID=C8X5X2_DESRD|nr:hypothetical protein Dret_2543 [Desulfohalobium retbaense DSM 5692]
MTFFLIFKFSKLHYFSLASSLDVTKRSLKQIDIATVVYADGSLFARWLNDKRIMPQSVEHEVMYILRLFNEHQRKGLQ